MYTVMYTEPLPGCVRCREAESLSHCSYCYRFSRPRYIKRFSEVRNQVLDMLDTRGVTT
jgi:hypothetical protein